jgi:hypothetical protein
MIQFLQSVQWAMAVHQAEPDRRSGLLPDGRISVQFILGGKINEEAAFYLGSSFSSSDFGCGSGSGTCTGDRGGKGGRGCEADPGLHRNDI